MEDIKKEVNGSIDDETELEGVSGGIEKIKRVCPLCKKNFPTIRSAAVGKTICRECYDRLESEGKI